MAECQCQLQFGCRPAGRCCHRPPACPNPPTSARNSGRRSRLGFEPAGHGWRLPAQAHGQAEHRPAARPAYSQACWGANRTPGACPGAAASGAGPARPAVDVHVHVNPTPRHRDAREVIAALTGTGTAASQRALMITRGGRRPACWQGGWSLRIGPFAAAAALRLQASCWPGDANVQRSRRPAASRSARLGAPCMSEFPLQLAGLQQAVLRARLCSCTGPSAAGLSLKTQCPVGSCIMFISN
jgi:hypothetical protein